MTTNQEYFTLELSSEIKLGIPLSEMATVAQFEVQNICTVPGVANFWYGVANFKGSLLWVLDSDRFFNLRIPRNKRIQKLTTIIIQDQRLDSQKKVAIAVQQLTGLVSLESSAIKPVADNIFPQLSQCCSGTVQTEAQTLYIIKAAALLQQLHQNSTLVSA